MNLDLLQVHFLLKPAAMKVQILTDHLSTNYIYLLTACGQHVDSKYS